MTNEERKREKAVKKIESAVRKAVGKGASKKEIEDTVGQAIVEATEKVAAKKAKEAPVKRAVAKKAPVKKAVAKKAPVKKAVVKRAPVKKAVVKKAPVKKAVAKKAAFLLDCRLHVQNSKMKLPSSPQPKFAPKGGRSRNRN
jgi:hypothetical protein